MSERVADRNSKYYVVGGGIASLAAAAFLIRDGDVMGHQISILEQSDSLGGSLDAGGNARNGYSMRGGRMLESKYVCTFDLFSSIPVLDGSRTVTEEILAVNRTLKTHSRARLFREGKGIEAPEFGVTERHILTLERIMLEPENLLGRSSIADQFEADFFVTDFWYMWCTTFAFQPWHSATEFKRYLVRFTHMLSGFNTLSGIMRTVYNQYDSMVRPLCKWLEERGVGMSLGARVTDLNLNHGAQGYAVDCILLNRGRTPERIYLGREDAVIVSLGSMTESSSLGSMDTAPILQLHHDGGAWALWEKLAVQQDDFGHPANFTDHVDESKWVSFTTTLHNPTFFNHVRDRTGNAPGEGGLITFPNSAWLLSIVLPHQPHFIGQPADVQVLWGYGLAVNAPGNFVNKAMSECSGREIMTELLGHLQLDFNAQLVLDSCNCIPCMMPYITNQFLPRGPGDRPQVVPQRSKKSCLRRSVLRGAG